MSEAKHIRPGEPVETYAILYSDGSVNCLVSEDLETVREQSCDDDKREDDPAHLSQIARVRIEVLEVIPHPKAKKGAPCPHCGQHVGAAG